MMTGTLNANDGRTRRQRCRAIEGSQGDYMKKCVTLLVAAIALAMSHSVTQAGEGQQSIPLWQLAGGYSFTEQGSFAGCFSRSFVEEPCDTAGVVVFPVT